MTNDFNDTKYYLRKKYEMCSECVICEGCPLSTDNNGKALNCREFEKNYPEATIAAVQEYHERKTKKHTYLDDFFNKFPDAPKALDGYPYIKPCFIYSEIKNNNKYACTLCSSNNCWDMKKE